MLFLGETILDYENGGFADVRCARCGQHLSRVQSTPPTDDDNPLVWEEKVQGEIDVLVREHQPECPAAHTDVA
jgi:hypothetical protein